MGDRGWGEVVREALLYEPLAGGKVRCLLCERRCVIRPGQRGFCGTRENRDGTLFTLVYGNISCLSANPIEKKPFFHFWPGSVALTAGTWSCNFTCPWCQNFDISKVRPDPSRACYIGPGRFVRMAKAWRCQGTSISFNEPTLLFDWALDVFKLARGEGLYNNYVSNGYMTEDALRALAEAGMDAIKFDVKGGPTAYRRYCGARDEVVWRNIGLARELGLHVEVVVLVIPGVNDDEETIRSVARRVKEVAGPETPLHFTRYYPAYKFKAPPTPVGTLEWAHGLAREEGLDFVYIGNVPGHPLEDTYCPDCGELLIKRYGFSILKYRLTSGKRCPRCGREIPVVGEHVRGVRGFFGVLGP
ncbi:AmmeMemoRadiSam system radical SAM enzyme [Candidatus Bathyarchaeota archaeon]|nr:MAG: AmmeMemoRadiSam system radical SAM enzyme [Candidatus Bathyarchaeota archaeon]